MKLILDREKKTFLYKKFFYGYIDGAYFIIQSSERRLKLKRKEIYLYIKPSLIGNTTNVTRILPKNFFLSDFPVGLMTFDLLPPDIIFESVHLDRKFYKFIRDA